MVRCARAWSAWEMTTCKLMQDPVKVKERVEAEDGRWAIAFARIEWYVVLLPHTCRLHSV